MYKIIELAHLMLQQHLTIGDVAIDATCGNGHDTLFLSQLVGETGKIYSYDIQLAALESAKILNANQNNITFIHQSHEFLELNDAKAVVFNFGYLPNGDKSITTKASSSLTAVKNIIKELKDNVLIIMVLYPGHQEGKIEADVLSEFCNNLSSKEFLVSTYKNSNQNNAPFLISIIKK